MNRTRTCNAVMAYEDASPAERAKEAYDHQSTLGALFDALPNTVGIPALAQFAYLQRVARRGNMNFLVSTFDPSGETIVFSRRQIAPRGHAAASIVLLKAR